MSKYGAKKSIASDGRVFDSIREKRRYEELLLLQKCGEITDLECQPEYLLLPKQYWFDAKGKRNTERPVTYRADFRYRDKLGNLHVEDAKGAKTQQYIIRRKLMLWRYDIHVEEV